MRISEYNKQIIENSFKGLKNAGVTLKVLRQESEKDMICKVIKDGISKLVWIHEGIAVAGIEA